MRIDDAPHVKLLAAIKATLELVDYVDRAGTATPVTVRHARNRKPVRGERPAVSILMVGDDARPAESAPSAWEMERELQVDLQADAELSAEDSDDDETGVGLLSRMLAASVEILQVSPAERATPLNGLIQDFVPGPLDPDEKSREDDGRLVRGVTVLYRVRSDDSNVLLAAGANA